MRKISWMITVLILLSAVRLATIAWLGLAPDEAYYLLVLGQASGLELLRSPADGGLHHGLFRRAGWKP